VYWALYEPLATKTLLALAISLLLEVCLEPARAGENVYSPNIARNGVDKPDLGPKIRGGWCIGYYTGWF